MASLKAEIKRYIDKPGYSAPTPQDVAASVKEFIFKRTGVRIARLTPTIRIKYGEDVHINEAKALDFVSKQTSIPVPKVLAAYTYGPIERCDGPPTFDTYIVTKYVEGQSLDKVWDDLDESAKSTIMDELKGYLIQLRAISGGDYIGSLDNGPVKDFILEYHSNQGPFASEEDFNNTLIDAYCAKYKGDIRPFMTGMLNFHKHGIVFTHADFRPVNIIVKDGHVTGIIDWELAGWYPEHWEFVKAFNMWWWQNDWGTRFLGIMQPYYCEQAFHGRLTQVLL